jgi:hypothetical protein
VQLLHGLRDIRLLKAERTVRVTNNTRNFTRYYASSIKFQASTCVVDIRTSDLGTQVLLACVMCPNKESRIPRHCTNQRRRSIQLYNPTSVLLFPLQASIVLGAHKSLLTRHVLYVPLHYSTGLFLSLKSQLHPNLAPWTNLWFTFPNPLATQRTTP